MSRYLCLIPHGDDEILGCGGTLLKALEYGHEVFLCYVTYSDAACPEYTQDEFTKMRKAETLEAARRLGIEEKNIFFLPELYKKETEWTTHYPPPLAEGGFYPLRLNERLVVHYLMKIIRTVEPHVIYLPHEQESHPDHEIVAREGRHAIRFSPGKWFRGYGESVVSFKIEEVWQYEVDTPLPRVDCVVDCSEFWKRKIHALQAHSTQDTGWFMKRTESWGRGQREVFLKMQ